MAYKLEFKPIILKALALDCDITQGELAKATGVSRPMINLCFNHGYMPAKMPHFKKTVEGIIAKNVEASKWLLNRGLKVGDIWAPLGKDLRKKNPAGTGMRVAASFRRAAMVPGDPDEIKNSVEVEMLKQETMRHFKVFRNPFMDDVQKETDIYMSDEHRYIEASMLDCARHGGFLAVTGEVGSGKSVIRRRVVEQLRKDGDVLVIFPQMVDKTRLTAASICDAIIMDISDAKPKMKNEAKTRQVQSLLLDRSKSGYRACLIIEEAHDLNTATLKYLKRFYELEDGYKKLLGIVLIGQTELKHMFNESMHVDMREVIRRCQVAEIKGLNGHIKEYLSLKFKRVGAELEKIFEPAAIAALSKRLTTKDREGKTVSHAYPLLVNNYTARAMNHAHELGEAKVTEAVVMAI